MACTHRALVKRTMEITSNYLRQTNLTTVVADAEVVVSDAGVVAEVDEVLGADAEVFRKSLAVAYGR